MVNFDLLRQNMIRGQVIPRYVTDPRILNSVRFLKREIFVPDSQRLTCYSESIIFLNKKRSRFLLPTFSLLGLIQKADLKEEDVVLDIACGTGYSSLILRSIAYSVTGVESDTSLLKRAEVNCLTKKLDGLSFFNTEITSGWPEGKPYDLIFIGGCVEMIPDQLLSQLGDKGRIVTIFKKDRDLPCGVLFNKQRQLISLFEVSCPVLPEFRLEQKFLF